MKLPDYTPGPWHVSQVNDAALIESEEGSSVAWAAIWTSRACERPMPILEHAANARLIAAAPVLLELLADMVRVLECGPTASDSDLGQRAKAAISKAKGEL